MRVLHRKLALLALLPAALLPAPATAAACLGAGVELQVLGSGGPELTRGRAASSYLIREAGRPRVLVDVGGGSAQRFGDAGARVQDLDLILLTHLHVDHSGDLPALVKSSLFQDRVRPLPLLGPGGNGPFPSTTQFVERLFGPSGAFAYLNPMLPAAGAAPGENYALEPRDIAPPPGEVTTVYQSYGLQISAASLQHGPVPALGWRVEIGSASVAFSGDTNGEPGGKAGALAKLARGVDVLVAHNAIPEGADGVPRALHMPPSVIGLIAREAAVKSVVLAHRMSRALGRENDTRIQIARAYGGRIQFADDLDCFPVGRRF